MKYSILTFTIFLGQFTFAQVNQYSSIKEIATQNKGVVVSAHPLASQVGAAVFAKGGNAFDAAIATQWALAVVYPQAGNIGGGGFLVASKNDGTSFTLDYREKAPQKANKDMYLDKFGNAQTTLSQKGSLAAGVPGTVDGLFESLKFAKLPMSVLIEPAIILAEKGFEITQREADLLNQYKEEFTKYNSHTPAFVKSIPWKKNDVLVQKELAETLKRIKKEGKNGFYKGKTAALIVAEMKKAKGIISLQDLQNYKTSHRKAFVFPYKSYEIVSMGLPSSGGILLNQMLEMSQIGGLDKYTPNSTQAVQIMVEAERRAYADRAKYMGDPDFVEDKTAYLTDKNYLKQRFSNFNWEKATPSADVGHQEQEAKQSEQTTHLSVLDKDGNAVSVTTTLNDLYGSKTIVAGAGFILNNEMDDFSIKPGVANMYGAVGGVANAIQPNKRMLSSMTPTIVRKNAKVVMVVGSPGGTTIPTSVFQSIVNVIDFKLSANKSVNQAKFHHQHLPEKVFVEKDFPTEVIENLQKKNYIVEKRGPIGRTELIYVDENNQIHAVADGRGDDSVAIEN